MNCFYSESFGSKLVIILSGFIYSRVIYIKPMKLHIYSNIYSNTAEAVQYAGRLGLI